MNLKPLMYYCTAPASSILVEVEPRRSSKILHENLVEALCHVVLRQKLDFYSEGLISSVYRLSSDFLALEILLYATVKCC